MSQWHGGKGSGQRKGADQKKYADNWDAIFGKKDKPEEKDEKSENNLKKVVDN